MWYVCLVTQSCPTLCDPCGLLPARLLCPWGFSRQEYWSGLPCPPPGDLPNPGIKPRSPKFQVDSLLSEPPGNPKNTRVGSLFLLQGIFPTQESNQGLLHCRPILYQLSYPEALPKAIWPYSCFFFFSLSLFHTILINNLFWRIQTGKCRFNGKSLWPLVLASLDWNYYPIVYLLWGPGECTYPLRTTVLPSWKGSS